MFCLLKKIYPNYVLKHDSNHKKQSYSCNDSNYRRMKLSCCKKQSALLRGIMPKKVTSQWFFLSELPSLCCNRKQTWIYKRLCGNKDFCNDVMPYEDTNILELNKYQKYVKVIKCNPEYLLKVKVSEHTPSGFLMPTISLFKNTENNHDLYRS